MKSWRLAAVALAILIVDLRAFVHAQDVKKPLEKVRLTVPAKSLTFVPYYFGKSQRLYEKDGIDLELIVMRPPIGVTALQAGEVDYSAAGVLDPRGDERTASQNDHVHSDPAKLQPDRPAGNGTTKN